MTLQQLVKANQFLIDVHSQEFYKIFKVPLVMYFHHIFGFDIVKFDEQLIQSGALSALEVIKACYGDEGAALIQVLLEVKDEFFR